MLQSLVATKAKSISKAPSIKDGADHLGDALAKGVKAVASLGGSSGSAKPGKGGSGPKPGGGPGKPGGVPGGGPMPGGGSAPGGDGGNPGPGKGPAGPAVFGGRLPMFAKVQGVFGKHDLSGISARTGEAADAATNASGALGMTQGAHATFNKKADFHTVAHVAAHAVQKREGAFRKPLGSGAATEATAQRVADFASRGARVGSILSDAAGHPQPGNPSFGKAIINDFPSKKKAMQSKAPGSAAGKWGGWGGNIDKPPVKGNEDNEVEPEIIDEDGGGGGSQPILKGPGGGGSQPVKGPGGGGGGSQPVKGPGGGGSQPVKGPGGGGSQPVKDPEKDKGGGGSQPVKGPGGGGSQPAKDPEKDKGGGGAQPVKDPEKDKGGGGAQPVKDPEKDKGGGGAQPDPDKDAGGGGGAQPDPDKDAGGGGAEPAKGGETGPGGGGGGSGEPGPALGGKTDGGGPKTDGGGGLPKTDGAGPAGGADKVGGGVPAVKGGDAGKGPKAPTVGMGQWMETHQDPASLLRIHQAGDSRWAVHQKQAEIRGSVAKPEGTWGVLNNVGKFLGADFAKGFASNPWRGQDGFLSVLHDVGVVVDGASSIAGTIGTIATVGGFILSILVPPIGAFLLTIGQFANMVALVLAGLKAVLGIVTSVAKAIKMAKEKDPAKRKALLRSMKEDMKKVVGAGLEVVLSKVGKGAKAGGSSFKEGFKAARQQGGSVMKSVGAGFKNVGKDIAMSTKIGLKQAKSSIQTTLKLGLKQNAKNVMGGMKDLVKGKWQDTFVKPLKENALRYRTLAKMSGDFRNLAIKNGGVYKGFIKATTQTLVPNMMGGKGITGKIKGLSKDMLDDKAGGFAMQKRLFTSGASEDEAKAAGIDKSLKEKRHDTKMALQAKYKGKNDGSSAGMTGFGGTQSELKGLSTGGNSKSFADITAEQSRQAKAKNRKSLQTAETDYAMQGSATSLQKQKALYGAKKVTDVGTDSEKQLIENSALGKGGKFQNKTQATKDVLANGKYGTNTLNDKERDWLFQRKMKSNLKGAQEKVDKDNKSWGQKLFQPEHPWQMAADMAYAGGTGSGADMFQTGLGHLGKGKGMVGFFSDQSPDLKGGKSKKDAVSAKGVSEHMVESIKGKDLPGADVKASFQGRTLAMTQNAFGSLRPLLTAEAARLQLKIAKPPPSMGADDKAEAEKNHTHQGDVQYRSGPAKGSVDIGGMTRMPQVNTEPPPEDLKIPADVSGEADAELGRIEETKKLCLQDRKSIKARLDSLKTARMKLKPIVTGLDKQGETLKKQKAEAQKDSKEIQLAVSDMEKGQKNLEEGKKKGLGEQDKIDKKEAEGKKTEVKPDEAKKKREEDAEAKKRKEAWDKEYKEANVFKKGLMLIGGAIATVFDFLADAAKWVWNQVIKPIIAKVKGILAKVMDYLAGKMTDFVMSIVKQFMSKEEVTRMEETEAELKKEEAEAAKAQAQDAEKEKDQQKEKAKEAEEGISEEEKSLAAALEGTDANLEELKKDEEIVKSEKEKSTAEREAFKVRYGPWFSEQDQEAKGEGGAPSSVTTFGVTPTEGGGSDLKSDPAVKPEKTETKAQAKEKEEDPNAPLSAPVLDAVAKALAKLKDSIASSQGLIEVTLNELVNDAAKGNAKIKENAPKVKAFYAAQASKLLAVKVGEVDTLIAQVAGLGNKPGKDGMYELEAIMKKAADIASSVDDLGSQTVQAAAGNLNELAQSLAAK